MPINLYIFQNKYHFLIEKNNFQGKDEWIEWVYVPKGNLTPYQCKVTKKKEYKHITLLFTQNGNFIDIWMLYITYNLKTLFKPHLRNYLLLLLSNDITGTGWETAKHPYFFHHIHIVIFLHHLNQVLDMDRISMVH